MKPSEYRVVEEARAFGLDVEAERCDVLCVYRDVRALRDMDEPFRSAAVARLNRGEPLRWSDEW